MTAGVPDWVELWALAGVLFHAGKWLTWRAAVRAGLRAPRARVACYFVLWPGMDAPAFLDPARGADPPARREWLAASAKTLVGLSLVYGGARLVPQDLPLLVGWVGLLGTAWFLLFGVFHVLSCGWRSLGVDAQPLWRSPLLATSLGDFWGNRWNLAFRDLARVVMFRPLRRRLGTRRAMLVVFLVSGLAHDVVFSIPAGAGYGLPLLYFAIQAAAIRVRGRLATLLITGPPSLFLFHPPFVERVYVPFLRAIFG